MYHLDIETHQLSPKYTIPPISPILIDYITVILGTQINSFECVFPLYHHSLILRGFQELPSSISPLPFSLPLIWHRLFPSPLCTVPVISYLSSCFPHLFALIYSIMRWSHVRFHSTWIPVPSSFPPTAVATSPAWGSLDVPPLSCLWVSVETLHASWSRLAPFGC